MGAESLVDTEGLVDAVCRMVRIPSFDGEETQAQTAMAELMEWAGLEVDLWEIDLREVQAHPLCSWEIPRTTALGLVGTLRGSGMVLR